MADIEKVKAGVPAELADFMTTERDSALGERTHEGTEGLTKEDIKMPRLVLLQKGSPQCTEGDPRYDETLKPGMYINDLTGEVYGKGPLYFTIIRKDKPRGVEFKPFEDGGGILDPDVPLDDPRMKFSKAGGKPVATKFYDFVCVLLPSLEPFVLSFKGGGLKAAKQLNGFITMRNDALWRGIYTIKSDIKMKPIPHHANVVANAGWINPTIAEKLAELFEAFKDREIVVDREPGEDDEDFPTGTSTTEM